MVGVTEDDLRTYRNVIDRLVHACREGQGQIGADHVRTGIWNRAAEVDPTDMPDQHAANDLLANLDRSEREVLAAMLTLLVNS